MIVARILYKEKANAYSAHMQIKNALAGVYRMNTKCKSCKNHSWHMALCFAPIALFIFLAMFFPQFAYLTFLAFLICPVSMGLMMYFMRKENKCGHNEKNIKQK